MNPFPKYLTEQISDKLRKCRVVVWYDPAEAFQPFVSDLAGANGGETVADISVAGTNVRFARYNGSYFALRVQLEPEFSVVRPDPILVYVPGERRNRQSSVLMEIESAGDCFEWALKKQARHAMREFFSDGVIDEMLAPDQLDYGDIINLLNQGTSGEQAGSMLKVLLGTSDSVVMLANWIATDENDESIESKGARTELEKLMASRAGFEAEAGAPLPKVREKLAQFLLANEFRHDLDGEAPTSISLINAPTQKEQREYGSRVLNHLRTRHADAFEQWADKVEGELGLATAGLSATVLGRIDTFRFEERAMLLHCADLIRDGAYGKTLAEVEVHSRSFWASHDLSRRQSQWEVCRLLGQLGLEIDRAEASLKKLNGNAKSAQALADLYTAEDGWHLVDSTHRHLETHVSRMDDEPEAEEALAIVRARVDTVLRDMAQVFTPAFESDHWTVPGYLHQTNIYPDKVEKLPGRVAWFHVDALRYEMGIQLSRQLPEAMDLELVAAVAALPSITPLCMAALLPGAAASYSVVEKSGDTAAKVGDKLLTTVDERMKYLKSMVPDSTDILLDHVLIRPPSKIEEKIKDARLVIVRSAEIDSLGEKSESLGRQIMDTVIGNLVRAIRKLTKMGFERFVITADHGHQFAARKEDDMKIPVPTGKKVGSHRRCWIGRGGDTPSGSVRLAAADLGYDSDLEFVFPRDLGVFKTQGGLTYHHGGFSLQELLVPVVSLRMPGKAPDVATGPKVVLKNVPEAITTRTVSVVIQVEDDLVLNEPLQLNVLMVANGNEAGEAKMAIGGDLDDKTSILTLAPGEESNVVLLLTREDVKNVKLVIQNAETGAAHTESKSIPVALKL